MAPKIYWPFPPGDVIEWPGERGGNWADHIGTDWPVAQGTRLRATASGTVDIIWNDGLGAWVIDIYTPDGFVLRHGHLSAMRPADGQWVNAGEDIGATGGRPGTPGAGLSTGDHFHWEIRDNGGWGAVGWYDPRKLDIHSFSELNKPAPLHGMDDAMIIYYAHAQGRNQPGWLILGYTAKPLILSTQRAANEWAAKIGSALTTDKGGFHKYLTSAGGTRAQLAKIA